MEIQILSKFTRAANKRGFLRICQILKTYCMHTSFLGLYELKNSPKDWDFLSACDRFLKLDISKPSLKHYHGIQ